MARKRSRTLTDLELDIMRVIWQRTEVSVEDLRRALEESGKPLALPSIRTMLSILQDKGFVSRRPEGRAFAYRALVGERTAKKSLLRDLVDRAFDGSAMRMVSALFDTQIVSEEEMETVRRLIDEHERRDRS